MNPEITQIILSIAGPAIVALVAYIARQLGQMNKSLNRLEIQMLQSDSRVAKCEGHIDKLYERTDKHSEQLAAHDILIRSRTNV